MNARDVIELCALALASIGSLTAAVLSWAQLRSDVRALRDSLARAEGLVAELNEARMRHVERFKDVEASVAFARDRLESLIKGEITGVHRVPLPRGRTP